MEIERRHKESIEKPTDFAPGLTQKSKTTTKGQQGKRNGEKGKKQPAWGKEPEKELEGGEREGGQEGGSRRPSLLP
jgi:hypothetical protein